MFNEVDMSRINKLINFFCLILIIYFPLSEIMVEFDVSDIGFILNQYEFVFSDIDSIYLPLLLTNIIGNIFLKIIRFFNFPEYLSFEILWAISCYYLCFLSARIYKKYCNDILVMPALVFAVILAKTNLNFFMYNTTVAVFSLTGMYFLITAINEKKEHYLALSVIMLCFSTLCKASAIIQFCMYGVLLYDFYDKRNKKRFIKQIFFCMAGFIAGMSACGIIVHYSCGIKKYLDMFFELFIYAGSSNDGHTISNMVLINVKGILHGFLWLSAAYLIYRVCNTGVLKKYQTTVGRMIIVITTCFVLGKILGLDKVKYIDLVYSFFWRYFEILAVVVAVMYVVAFYIINDRNMLYQYKIMVLTSVILLFCMPIGSNVGIPHLCNELFIAMPFIFIFIKNKFYSISDIKEKNIKLYLVMTFTIFVTAVSLHQAFYRSNNIIDENKDLTTIEIPQLRYIRTDNENAEYLEGVLDYLAQHEEYESLTVVGSVPIINYLSDIRTGVKGCGGWIETDYVSALDIQNDLYVNKPVIIICNDVIDNNTEKNQIIKSYIIKEDYGLYYKNKMYSLYYYK